MKKGDRVRKSPMWKYEQALGVVEKLTADGYVVVVWDDIKGHWHYTAEQAKTIEVIND